MIDNVVFLKNYRCDAAHDVTDVPETDTELSPSEIKRLSHIRDEAEHLLDALTARHRDPVAVAYAAARYASMRLYQIQGRAETIDFVNQCIETLEIAGDIFQAE